MAESLKVIEDKSIKTLSNDLSETVVANSTNKLSQFDGMGLDKEQIKVLEGITNKI